MLMHAIDAIGVCMKNLGCYYSVCVCGGGGGGYLSFGRPGTKTQRIAVRFGALVFNFKKTVV